MVFGYSARGVSLGGEIRAVKLSCVNIRIRAFIVVCQHTRISSGERERRDCHLIAL